MTPHLTIRKNARPPKNKHSTEEDDPKSLSFSTLYREETSDILEDEMTILKLAIVTICPCDANHPPYEGQSPPKSKKKGNDV